MTGRHARIAGVEYVLPERVVTNAEIAAAHPGWRMKAVALRTGVQSRHIAAEHETALDLAERACRKLMSRLSFGPDDVDFVLFCTQTPDHVMPPNACLLQARLGLPEHVGALDFSLACSGYIYGLVLAKALIASGEATRVLLVTADTYSKLINPGDRSAFVLFGDGAAATLIVLDQRPGIGSTVLGTDGSRAACFAVPAGGARQRRSAATTIEETDRSGNVRTAEQIHMDGPAVLAFVQREVPRLIEATLRKAGLELSQIDLVLFHQASGVALEYLTVALGLTSARVFTNLGTVGNTVSASLGILLRDAEQAGRLAPGMKLLLVGFGVGLSWGACVIEW